MSVRELRGMQFTCDCCTEGKTVNKKDHEHTYPDGWVKVVLRGKTRKEFDLCEKCAGKLETAIEEGISEY